MKKNHITVISVILIAIVAVAVIGLCFGKIGLAGNKEKTIELAYGFSMKVPGKYADMVEHTQDYYGERISDTFVLKSSETDVSLFRIDFGDRESGDWLGELNIDDRQVPVTYTIFSVERETITKLDDDTKEAYAFMLEDFNRLLSTIAEDPRFLAAEVQAEAVTDQQIEMQYWSVSLMNGIVCEEMTQDGEYQADFFGTVQGEKIKLYSVHIGDKKLQTELGLFEIDGVRKTVSVESYSLNDQNNWDQSDYELAYRMMDTINNVIDRIMASESFSEPSEG